MSDKDFADKDTIKDILENCRIIAVVGISDNPDRPSYHVASYMLDSGYEIIPVNPSIEQVLGRKSYPDLLSIPQKVDVIDIFRRSETVGPIVDDAIKIGAKAIWLQEGIINEEACLKAKQAGLKVVMDRCMLKEHSKMQHG
ncbi:MAG: CoA-binding protein [candidate division Zixibacteria bacterium]|nr:CoA-binding protein [candidate division Zixibacteria bacterium]